MNYSFKKFDYTDKIHSATIADGGDTFGIGGPGYKDRGWLSGGSYKGTLNWAVGVFPDKSVIVPLAAFTPKVVHDFIETNAPWLTQTHYWRKAQSVINTYCLGTWVYNGQVYLDIVKLIPDNGPESEQEARILAAEYNQLAIYNLGDNREVAI